MTEEAPTEPVSVYGRSKLMAEQLIKEFEDKYQYEFGYTAINNQFIEMNRFTQVTYAPGVEVSVEQDVIVAVMAGEDAVWKGKKSGCV